MEINQILEFINYLDDSRNNAKDSIHKLLNFFKKNNIDVNPSFSMQLLNKSEKLRSIMFYLSSDNQLLENEDFLSLSISYELIQYNSNKDGDLLTREEERELFIKIEQGDENARDIVVEKNTRLVWFIANKYRGNGLDYEDLVQCGFEGLLKAIDRFDYRKGFKFSTYATWYIRQSVTRAVQNESKTIRLPVNNWSEMSRYRHDKDLYNYSTKEMAEHLNISVEKAILYEQIINEMNLASLNSFIGEDNNDELIGVIEDKSNISVEERAYLEMLPEEIKKLFEKARLTNTEIIILYLRTGYYNDTLYTLDEIGKMFGKTRERIRQIEMKTIKKLKRYRYLIYDDENKTKKDKIIKDINIPDYEKWTMEMTKNTKGFMTSIYKYFTTKTDISYSKEDIDKALIKLYNNNNYVFNTSMYNIICEIKIILDLLYNKKKDFNSYDNKNFLYKYYSIKNHKTLLLISNLVDSLNIKFDDSPIDYITFKEVGKSIKLLINQQNMDNSIKDNKSNLDNTKSKNTKKSTSKKNNNTFSGDFKGIYTYLQSYSKEDVASALNHITNEEMRLLKLVYGDDLTKKIYKEDEIDKRKDRIAYIINALLPRLKKYILEKKLEDLNTTQKTSLAMALEDYIDDTELRNKRRLEIKRKYTFEKYALDDDIKTIIAKLLRCEKIKLYLSKVCKYHDKIVDVFNYSRISFINNSIEDIYNNYNLINMLKVILNTPLVEDLDSYMYDYEYKIVELYYNIISRGKIGNISEIANDLNVSLEVIEKAIKKVLLVFYTKVMKYQISLSKDDGDFKELERKLVYKG